MKRRVAMLAIGLAVSFPFGGFLFGFVTCEGCGWNIFGRMFIGCVFAVLTPMTLGFPPKNEGGVGEPYNAWPFILFAWFVISSLLLWRDIRAKKRSMTTNA